MENSADKKGRSPQGGVAKGTTVRAGRLPSRARLLAVALAEAADVGQVLEALVTHGGPWQGVTGAALVDSRQGVLEARGELAELPLEYKTLEALARRGELPETLAIVSVEGDVIGVLSLRKGGGAHADTLKAMASLALRSAYIRDRLAATLGRLRALERKPPDQEALERAIIEDHDHALMVVDRRLRILRSNATFRRTFNVGCEGALGMAMSQVVPDPQLTRMVRRTLDTGETVREMELGYSSPGQETRYFLVSISRLELERRACALVVFNEVTEWKRRQLQVMEASHLVSVGEMAAGIAHEINNPLAAIMGFAQLVLRRDLPGEVLRDVEKILSEARRAAKVVANLQSFARRHKPRKEYIDLAAVLLRVIEARSYELRVNNVEVVTRIDPDLPKTMADQQQMSQVFLNIIMNAEQAVTAAYGGGTLYIEGRQVGDRIRFSFADDGPGIAEEALPKIFDPFFSTKPVGKGTGLGLSTCYGIIHEHGGTIRAENRPEGGALFVVELPVLSERGDAVARESAPGNGSRPRRILVVDDEPAIVEFLGRLLRSEGYAVDTATSGEEALSMPRLDSYDLLLLDFKMPGVDGARFFDHLRALSQDLASRVVFITGDISDADTQAFIEKTDNPVLAKPFSMEELEAVIRRSLEGSRRGPARGGRGDGPAGGTGADAGAG